MREEDKRRVENVRLIRLPNGQLVTEERAAKLQGGGSSPMRAASPNMPQQSQSQDKKIHKTRRERGIASQQSVSSAKKPDKDILDVWQKQEEIKKETERLELEYEVTKKMAKELKRKLKERDQPYAGESVDDAFKDLLSPEAKQVAKKLHPHLKKAKTASKNRAKLFSLSLRRYGRFAILLAKKSVSTKKRAVITVFACVMTILMIGLYKTLDKPTIKVQDVQGATTAGSKIQKNVKPDFATLSPANKNIEDLGGYAKISPPNSASAYAYKDEIDSIPVKVTQQQLPDKLKSSPSEMESLAKSYYATKKVQVDNTTVYIGKSEKGPITGIFSKDGILVFVTAERDLSEIQWVQYVTNLVKK